MACSSTTAKDFLKGHGHSSNSSSSDNNDSSVAENKDSELLVGGSSLNKLRKDMFRTMDLFQKNDFIAKNNDGHTDDSILKTFMMMKDLTNRGRGDGYGDDAKRRNPSSLMIQPELFGGSRPPSRLERSLLPGARKDARLPIIPSTGDQKGTAQLTIFYNGMINVYDNVTADKAQAIMLLANQCSASPPLAQNATKVDVTRPIPRSHSPSLVNGPEDLPIARKHSLRRFLEKRRDRMVNRSPYAYSED